MAYLLAVSLVANLVVVWLFLGALTRTGEEARAERAQLLNRIQAPEQAVALSIEPDDTPNFMSQYDEFKVTDES